MCAEFPIEFSESAGSFVFLRPAHIVRPSTGRLQQHCEHADWDCHHQYLVPTTLVGQNADAGHVHIRRLAVGATM